MKIAIYGAGAIGGLLGVKLCQAGHDVSLIARGEHLSAIQHRGLRLCSAGESVVVHPRATDEARVLGPQDLVIIAVKAPALPAVAEQLSPLLTRGTLVVPAMNGVPWWFGYGLSALAEERLSAYLDPRGALSRALPLEQVIGCVVYPTGYVSAPGIVQHTGRWDLQLGTPVPHGVSARQVEWVCQALTEAGFSAQVAPDLRAAIWTKLVGNASFNAVSALTCATLDRLLAEPATYDLLTQLMEEVLAVGRACGLRLDESPQARLAKAVPLGPIKFSMLQDLEQGRPLEHRVLTGAVLELARALSIAVPALEVVHALIAQRAQAAAVSHTQRGGES